MKRTMQTIWEDAAMIRAFRILAEQRISAARKRYRGKVNGYAAVRNAGLHNSEGADKAQKVREKYRFAVNAAKQEYGKEYYAAISEFLAAWREYGRGHRPVMPKGTKPQDI